MVRQESALVVIPLLPVNTEFWSMLLGGEIIWNQGLGQAKMLCPIPTRKRKGIDAKRDAHRRPKTENSN
jgi:hypothetical protein